MNEYDKKRLDLLDESYRTLNREMGEVLGELKTIRRYGAVDIIGRVAEIAALVVILSQLL